MSGRAPARPVRRKRASTAKLLGAIAAVLGGIAAVITAAVAVVNAAEAATSHSVTIAAASSSAVPIASGSVTARIVNTWDDASKSNIGVFRYVDPNSDARAGVGLPEGSQVTITCQYLHGRQVTDTPHGDRQTSSTRWDRLQDGSVISDIYTDLKKPAGKPTPGLAACP